MFERFTDNAKKSMAGARSEAHRLKHDFIGTEHMLLGVLLFPESLGVKVLADLGIDAAALRVEAERLAGEGTTPSPLGQFPFTPAAKKVLELSMVEAAGIHHRHIGTEHLILGLIHEESGVARRALAALGATLERARESVVRHLGKGYLPLSVASAPLLQTQGDECIHAVHAAEKEALRLGHTAIGPEELLLGAVADPSSRACAMLMKLDVVPRALAEDVEKRMIRSAPSSPIAGITPFSRDAIRVLGRAFEEALLLGSTHLDTRHLLLALLQETAGPVSNATMRIDSAAARDAAARI